MQVSETYRSTGDGARLFSWRAVPAGPSRGVVCLVHGVCEHAGRYQRLTARFCEAGYTVSAFDLRGHGKSSGRRGDTRLAPTLADLDALVTSERAQAEGRPIYLYGHSLGGLLVLAYGLERRPEVAGIVASAPALHTSLRENRVKVAVAQLLGGVLPSIALPAGLDSTMLSRDPAVVEDYRADPLVHQRVTLGMGRDVLRAIDRVLRDAAQLTVPLLLVHGAADRVNYPSGSQAVAEKLGTRATLRLYDGMLHQPHTDPDSPRVFDDVIEWFAAHAGGTQQSISRAQ